MKKQYISPEILLRRVIIEGIMEPSMPLDDTPIEGDWEGIQESKDGNGLWSGKGNDVWED